MPQQYLFVIASFTVSHLPFQPMSATAIALAVADCSFSVIQPVFTARDFPLGCIPDAELMSFIARRSGGVMWIANLAALGAVLITPEVFGALDKLASRSHSLPEIQIILDAVSQRCSFFPLGRISEPPHPRSPTSSLHTVNPSLGVALGVVAGHVNQPRLLHKDTHNTNMQVICYSIPLILINHFNSLLFNAVLALDIFKSPPWFRPPSAQARCHRRQQVRLVISQYL